MNQGPLNGMEVIYLILLIIEIFLLVGFLFILLRRPLSEQERPKN